MNIVEHALRYLERGWSVIPVHKADKLPLVRWKPFQNSRPSLAQVEAWFARWPEANVGIVTGRISGLVVLDVDGALGRKSLSHFDDLALTPVVQTGKGMHYYFAHPGKQVPNRAGLLPGLDLRGDGGFVVAPPSRHSSGRCYAWVPSLGPDDTELAALLHGLAESSPTVAQSPLSGLLQGVPEGQRNQATARLAGQFLARRFTTAETLFWLRLWNAKNRPPLSEDELGQVVHSIAGRERRQMVERGG